MPRVPTRTNITTSSSPYMCGNGQDHPTCNCRNGTSRVANGEKAPHQSEKLPELVGSPSLSSFDETSESEIDVAEVAALMLLPAEEDSEFLLRPSWRE
eukprot:g38507.t1